MINKPISEKTIEKFIKQLETSTHHYRSDDEKTLAVLLKECVENKIPISRMSHWGANISLFGHTFSLQKDSVHIYSSNIHSSVKDVRGHFRDLNVQNFGKMLVWAYNLIPALDKNEDEYNNYIAANTAFFQEFLNGEDSIEILGVPFEIKAHPSLNSIEFQSPRRNAEGDNIRRYKFDYNIEERTIGCNVPETIPENTLVFSKNSPRKQAWNDCSTYHKLPAGISYAQLKEEMVKLMTAFYTKKNLW